MTDPSTDSLPGELREIRRLALSSSCYYLKRSGIVGRIEHGGRTFYPRFERIPHPPNPVAIRQHLDREITLALPLLDARGWGERIVILYQGEQEQRFAALIRRLFHHLDIERYRIYRGKHPHDLQIHIPVAPAPLDRLHRQAGELSDMLQTRLNKSWKILPDIRLPEEYNIFTIPYGIY